MGKRREGEPEYVTYKRGKGFLKSVVHGVTQLPEADQPLPPVDEEQLLKEVRFVRKIDSREGIIYRKPGR